MCRKLDSKGLWKLRKNSSYIYSAHPSTKMYPPNQQCVMDKASNHVMWAFQCTQALDMKFNLQVQVGPSRRTKGYIVGTVKYCTAGEERMSQHKEARRTSIGHISQPWLLHPWPAMEFLITWRLVSKTVISQPGGGLYTRRKAMVFIIYWCTVTISVITKAFILFIVWWIVIQEMSKIIIRKNLFESAVSGVYQVIYRAGMWHREIRVARHCQDCIAENRGQWLISINSSNCL